MDESCHLDRIVREHWSTIRHIAYSVHAPNSLHDAEDYVSILALVLLRCIPLCEPRALKTYFRRAAHRELFRSRRSGRSDGSVHSFRRSIYIEEVEDPSYRVEDDVLTGIWLDQLMAPLSAIERRVLLAEADGYCVHAYHGHSEADLYLGLGAGTAHAARRRARRKIKQMEEPCNSSNDQS